MDNLQEIGLALLMGLGLILALVFTASFSMVMVAVSAKAWRSFVAVDQRLAPIGQTLTGQYIHDQLASLMPYVDQPDDPLIQQLLRVPVLKQLHKEGYIDDKALSKGLSQALNLTIDLFDGEPIAGG